MRLNKTKVEGTIYFVQITKLVTPDKNIINNGDVKVIKSRC